MEIQEVKLKYEEDLMLLPNVVGVGIGEKEGKAVIKVFVTRRVPESSLKNHEVIPGSLEGHKVVVEEVDILESETL